MTMTAVTESWVPLCSRDDVSDDGMYAFEIDDRRIAIYVIAGGIYATDNVCSHAFALLTDGWVEDGVVECPLHGAQFDIATGAVLRGPADCAIPTFETRISGNNIEVRLE